MGERCSHEWTADPECIACRICGAERHTRSDRRRLIGWRVRWEYRVYADGQWREDYTHLIALPIARDRARYLRDDERVRHVRVLRVYCRRRTP